MSKHNIEGRLDIDSILAITEMFCQNISIPEAEKWGVSKETFCPFKTIPQDKEIDWKKENGLWDIKKDIPLDKFPPKSCHPYPNIRWMPDYTLENKDEEYFAYLKFSPDYATIWQPTLVGIDFSRHRIFSWDKTEDVWAEFKFESLNSTDKAFFSFLHSWIWHNFQF